MRAHEPAEAGAAAPTASLGYVDGFNAAFVRAGSAAGGFVDRHLSIGRVDIRLRFAGVALAEALWPAFAHLRLRRTGAVSLTVGLWDGASTGIPAPALRLPAAADGAIVRYSDGRVRLRRELWGALSVVDAAARTAFYWVPSPELPAWELAAPMRSALHLALSRRGSHLVHAAAVGLDGIGVLLAGPGGAGKSTVALACVEAGFEFLGDDFVLLETSGGRPTAYSVYGTAKVDRDELAAIPGLALDVAPSPIAQGDKVVVFVNERRPAQLRAALAIDHVVLPRITGGPAAIRTISAGEALRVLAPSTIFALSDGRQGILATAADLVSRVPCHVLELGPDRGDGPRLLADLLRNG